MTRGETDKIPFSIRWTWYARKNKGHTIVMHVFYEMLLRLIKFFGYCYQKCFYIETINSYVPNKILYLWIKWITSPDVNRFIVKSLTYYPTIIRLASLRPDSGVYTLSHSSTYINFIISQSYSYVSFKN